MKRLLFIVFCLFLYIGSFAWAETFTTRQTLSDDETFTVDSGDTYYYDGDKVIDAIGHSNVTVINNGNIIAHQTEGSPTELIHCGGGCDDTVDASGSVNFTLTNNGTIWAGHNRTIDLRSATGDITLTNNVGAKIAAGERLGGYDVLDLDGAGSSGDTITIVNHGAIENIARNWNVIGLASIDNGAIVNFTNTGTITLGTDTFGDKNKYYGGVVATDSTDEINFDNSGTIQSSRRLFTLDGTTNFTLTNSGTIKQDNFAYHGVSDSNAPITHDYSTILVGTSGSGVTIINSGTISASHQNNHGITIGDNTEDAAHSNATIENSGTISAGSDDFARAIIIIPSASGTITSGTTIKVKEEAEFTGGIDLGKTESTIVLDSSITKDITIEIYNYDGDLTITNNLTGNDTYSITVEDLDSDSASDDGTLTIFGEDLEIAQNNAQYRAENTVTKLRGLFNAANYIGGRWPDHCTTVDPENVDSKLDESCNQRFVKLFHSYQTRDDVYDGTSSGIVGMLSPIKWKGFPLVSNIFVGYSNQEGDFNNGEYLGGDNFALGFKNTYENKGFKASLTPMIGINDLAVIDFDPDKVQTVTNNFVSEFAAVNGKIQKKIETGEDRTLNVSVETTYGLQRFPDYISKFTDGDLSVDESIEKLLSGGFEVAYVEGLPGSFIIKPYFGANLSKNLSNHIKITADGENKNVSPKRETWSGYYAGVSLTKEAKGIDFDLNLMYGNEDGLINQIAAVSLIKSFGTSKKETIKLEPVPDLPKADESLTTQDYTKDLNKLETQNEKLKLLAEKVLQENEISKHLIKELVTEVEKLKLTNQIFKDKILKLENENVELPQTIEEGDQKPKIDKLGLFLFFVTVIGLAAGLFYLIIPSKYLKFRFVN